MKKKKRKSRQGKKESKRPWNEPTQADSDDEMVKMFTEAADAYLHSGDEPNMRGLLECLLPHYLDDEDKHWTQVKLTPILFSEGYYDICFNLISHALRVSPNCPEARFQLGRVLAARPGQQAEAISVWTEIIRTPIRKLAYSGCRLCQDKSIPFARVIVRDCKYALALGYWTAGYPALGRYFKKTHLKDSERGIGTRCVGEELEIITD